jgi:NADH:ubiquinone reductase (H+-translocating)
MAKIKKQKVVIVGGGFGGVKTALELCKQNAFDVTLISDLDHMRYYPSLYRTATGKSREISWLPLEGAFHGTSKPNIVHATAEFIDRAQKVVKTKDGKEYAYDYLVLSLGVVTNYFNIPGLQEYSFGIKTLEDAEEFKTHLHEQIITQKKPDLNYVIAGGGPTGVELAGVLGDYINYICDKHGIKRRSVHVDLVEGAPRLLIRMPKSVSRRVQKQLRKKGVRLYLNARVEGESADELTVNGKPIRSHTVVWTAGVTNNPFFASNNFQLSSTRKVRVDQYLMAEPSIFVIGDNADTPYSGMAQTAIYDASYVARALTDIVINKQAPKPYVAKKPIYVLPAGADWAAVVWGRMHYYGAIGSLLHKAAEFACYHDYEPFFYATKRWFADFDRQDLCPICDNNGDLLTRPA